VVGDIPDQTVAEGDEFLTIHLDDYVSDADDGDEEMTWTYAGNTELSVVIADRVATIGIPHPDWSGSETITFTATDPGLSSDSDGATFTVAAVNDAPVVGDIPDQTVAEGDAFLTINLDDYVSDVDNGDAEMTWTYAGNAELTVSIGGNRVATIAIPDPDWSGSETVTFTATDPGDESDSDEATFTVTPVNDLPVAVDDSVTTNEDTPVVISVLTNDSDPDDDTLTISDYDTFSTQGGTVGCTNAGVCTYTPPADFNCTDTFTYTVSDGNGGTDNATVTISVIATAPLESLMYLPLILNNHVHLANVRVDAANLPKRYAPQRRMTHPTDLAPLRGVP